jgi:myo-inositol catabolism protein IolC
MAGMSQTAKARLAITKEAIEKDLAMIHPDDRKDYAEELRDLLLRALSAARRSSHDRHTSAVD